MSKTEELRFPLVILGGRDRQSTVLPEEGRDKHLLHGFKAVDLRIGGRPLIEVVVERLRATGAFDPIYVSGPAAAYRPVISGVRLIDTDSSFGDNLRACVETLTAELPGRQAVFTTADILAEPAELERAIGDLRSHQPCDFWMPQIRIDDVARLGQSAWKPKYRIRPEGEERGVTTLPSHLIAVDPAVARLELIFRLFDVLYRTRNRSVGHRTRVAIREVLLFLFRQDLRRLLRLRLPVVTPTVVYNALTVARSLANGTADQHRLEVRIRRAFITEEHRRRHPERRGRVPILDALSLAKDIDTEEEAREAGGS